MCQIQWPWWQPAAKPSNPFTYSAYNSKVYAGLSTTAETNTGADTEGQRPHTRPLQPAPPSATPGGRTVSQASHRTLPTQRWVRLQTYTIADEECVTNIFPREPVRDARTHSGFKRVTRFPRAIFILLFSSLVITGSAS